MVRTERAPGEPLRVLDLFSGIGGFALGLSRAARFETVAFCEIEPYCRAVLRAHWPGVPIYGDIRHLTATRLASDGIAVDMLCGGFPCQDISDAGAQAGLEGERSGLWSDFARLIGEIRPRWVLAENVSSLLFRGFDRVLGDLASIGYDAEWHCIPATYVGAPHRRDRIFIVAYPVCERYQAGPRIMRTEAPPVAEKWSHIERCGRRPCPPGVLRMADGVPFAMDRIAGLGNSVIPDLITLLGNAIATVEKGV